MRDSIVIISTDFLDADGIRVTSLQIIRGTDKRAFATITTFGNKTDQWGIAEGRKSERSLAALERLISIYKRRSVPQIFAPIVY